VLLTLNKISLGGIYDQVGGGFARYSVDMLWKVPHFEKMLYDNGQLLHSYALAYADHDISQYKRILEETMHWLKREMTHESGAFYSALDADSEGVEGKFYVWSKEEITSLFGPDHWIFSLYEFNLRGLWEENYIPLRLLDDTAMAREMNWSEEKFREQLNALNQELLSVRSVRVRPGLDDKCLTSWNAMTLKGLCTTHRVLGDEQSLSLAIQNAKWLRKYQLSDAYRLLRSFKNGHSTIDAFLEDYAHVIDGLIALYQVTFDESWLIDAFQLCEKTVELFFDKASGMFFFTEEHTELIARKMEIQDNVIPSGNSVMAHNLLTLSVYFLNGEYRKMAIQMLANVSDGMELYGSAYSNWARLQLRLMHPEAEIVVTGPGFIPSIRELDPITGHRALLCGSSSETSELPILRNRTGSDDTRIFICSNGQCQLPVTTVQEARDLIIQH